MQQTLNVNELYYKLLNWFWLQKNCMKDCYGSMMKTNMHKLINNKRIVENDDKNHDPWW